MTAIPWRRRNAAPDRLLRTGGSWRSRLTLAGCYQTEVRKKNIRPTIVNVTRSCCTKARKTSRFCLAAIAAALRQASAPMSWPLRKPGGTKQAAESLSTCRRRADRSRRLRCDARNPFDLCCRRRPSNAIYVRAISPPNTSLASIRLNYTKLIAEAGRAESGRRTSARHYDSGFAENQPYWNFGCACSATWRPWSTTRPISFSRAVKSRPMRRVARPCSTMAQRRKSSGIYVGYDAGKISDLGK